MISAQTPKKTVSVMKEVTWKVPNYSKTNFAGYRTGVAIRSNTFTVSNAGVKTKWFLEVLTNGNGEESKLYISLYLCSASANEADCINFNIKFRLGVVKKNHQKCYLKDELKLSKEEMKEHGYGCPKFLSHEELFHEANGFVVDEILSILAELNIEYEVENVKAQTRVCVFTALSAKRKDDLKKMFENDDLADFQLKVSDGEILKAHKIVLAARSPVFFAKLTNDMKDSKDCSVDDIDSVVMKEVLRFIYYNEVEGSEQIAPKLIFAAEKYQLDELKDYCIEEMITAIEPQNVTDYLIISQKISGSDELFNGCLDFILNNYSEVRQCPSWKELSKELMAKILDESCERNPYLAI